MRAELGRAILTVVSDGTSWAVELGGERFGHSPDKEIARAFAHKRARQMLDGGQACEVRVAGEHGMFGTR